MKKKLLTIIISLAAAFCLCFGLAACAGVGTEGTYYLIENDKYVKETYFTLQGGKWTDDDGVSGEYEINGDAITLYTDLFGTKMEFTSGTVKDGVLTLKGIYGDKVYAQEGAWKGASGGNQGGNQGGSPSAKEYSVTYDANGGTFSGGQNTYTQTVKEGNKLTAPTSPTRKNYTFAGWAKSKNGSAMWKFDEDTVSENITLYAQWTQESAVILSVDGASIEGREIFMLVDHTTVEVSLSNKVVCSDDSIWRLYSDPEGQREIPTKMVTNLKSGENVYYLVVNSQNQAQVNVYKFTVHRSYLVTISYYNGETLLETAETYTGEHLQGDARCERRRRALRDGKDDDLRQFLFLPRSEAHGIFLHGLVCGKHAGHKRGREQSFRMEVCECTESDRPLESKRLRRDLEAERQRGRHGHGWRRPRLR